MNYTPFAGNLKKYGQGPEHNFFPAAQAQPVTLANAAPTTNSPAYEAAMRSLGVISSGGNGGVGDTVGGNNNNNSNNPNRDPDVDPGSRLDLSLSNSTVGSLLGNAAAGTFGGLAGGAIGGLMDVSKANAIANEAMVDPVAVNAFEAALAGAFGPVGGWLGLRDAYEQNFDNLAGNMNLVDRPDLDPATVDAFFDSQDTTDAMSNDAAQGIGQDAGGSSASDPSDMAAGGPVKAVDMHNGGFVIPADVVSGLGDGSTEAGYRRLGIGKLIKGPGTGMSDDIPANIDGSPEAKVADGEVYVNPKEVKLLGGGNYTKGMKRLEALLDEVRHKRHGTTEQPKPLNLGALA